MLAFICRFYHWTLEYVLNMPAQQFFLMHNQATKLQALEYMNACDIAAIPMCNPIYFETVRSKFESAIKKDFPMVQDAPTTKPVFKAESKAAKYAVMNAFASIKRH